MKSVLIILIGLGLATFGLLFFVSSQVAGLAGLGRLKLPQSWRRWLFDEDSNISKRTIS
jgi:hypothetical protein